MGRAPRQVKSRAHKVRLYTVLSNYRPRIVFEVHPSREQARGGAHLAYSGPRSYPVESVAVSTESSRYRLAYVDWDGYAKLLQQVAQAKPDTLPSPFGDITDSAVNHTGFSRRVIQRDARRYRTDPASFSNPPRHLLDLPPVVVGCSEHEHKSKEYCERERALAAAARENRKRKRHYGGGDWAIVLELGEVVPGSVRMETDFAGDVGVQREHCCRVVRIVRPTENEVKLLAGPMKKG
jgi:hypothetical protein